MPSAGAQAAESAADNVCLQRPDTRIGMPDMLALRSVGRQSPLFLIESRGSAVASLYASLLARVGDDIPVYLLRYPDTHGALPHTIEGMAAQLIALIRGVQPHGPYRLAGWEVGGLLAYEVAILLLGRNQSIEFIGLINTAVDASAGGTKAWRGSGKNGIALNYHLYPIQGPVHVFVPVGGMPAQDPGRPPEPCLGWERVLRREQLRRVELVGKGTQAGAGIDGDALGSALAAALLQAAAKREQAPELRYNPLVKIQTGTRAHTPIVVVPGAGANVFNFIPFADALGRAWPIYGLQPRGVEGEHAPHSSVAAAAQTALAAIDAARAELGESFHLVGHSFGGWIALEIARRLRERGQAPVSLTLIDSEAPDTDGVLGQQYTFVDILMKLIQALEQSCGRSLQLERGELACQDTPGRWRLLKEGMVRAGLLPPRSRPEDLVGMVRTYGSALRTGYRLDEVYPGPVHLVLADDESSTDPESSRARRDIRRAWERSAPILDVWDSRGNHFTMLKPPHVQELAAWWLRLAKQVAQ